MILASLFKSERRLEIHFREGFDQVDPAGVKLLTTGQDSREVHEILDKAIDILEGTTKSVIDPERWSSITLQELKI